MWRHARGTLTPQRAAVVLSSGVLATLSKGLPQPNTQLSTQSVLDSMFECLEKTSGQWQVLGPVPAGASLAWTVSNGL